MGDWRIKAELGCMGMGDMGAGVGLWKPAFTVAYWNWRRRAVYSNGDVYTEFHSCPP